MKHRGQKERQKQIQVIGVICLSLAGLWALSRGVRSAPLRDSVPFAAPESRAPAAISQAQARLPSQVAEDSPPAGAAEKTPAGPSSESGALAFDRGVELAKYAGLKKKVFLSPDEKAEQARILEDRGLVNSLLSLLLVPALPGSMTMHMQNDAIDLLLEARAAGVAAASEVLRSVVEDKKIEDTSVDMETRTSLAGVKAEVLYQWSAQEPERASELERWLPGPVSQKIWNNVISAQRQNLNESEDEAASMQAKK